MSKIERQMSEDLVRSVDGFLLCGAGVFDVDGVQMVSMCDSCFYALRNKTIPHLSLANGLWLGEVPEVLGALNFVEKMLVGRFHHNACLVRIDMGRRRFRVNAVVFLQPIVKIRNALPPPREDIEECLAVVLMKLSILTAEDLKRMPFLVQKNVVLDALRWLQLNNSEYADLEISLENMDTYEDGSPPVAVIHRECDGVVPSESMSVFDAMSEKGTDSGMCSFAVHGLTADDVAHMSYDTVVAMALKHLRSGGSVLAIGWSSAAESMYHNLKLYPGMFLWLFPYGLGRFENAYMDKRLGRKSHVWHLLMYYD